MTDEELKQQIMERLTVPLWPHTAQALGLGRNSVYEGMRSGRIPTVGVGGKFPVPTHWLRRQLFLDKPET
jgi:hypothetical protein